MTCEAQPTVLAGSKFGGKLRIEDGDKALVVQPYDDRFRGEQAVYQRARENVLMHRRLVKEMEKTVPLQRWAQPVEYAYAVCFLASSQADFITGQTLSPNGGSSIVGI